MKKYILLLLLPTSLMLSCQKYDVKILDENLVFRKNIGYWNMKELTSIKVEVNSVYDIESVDCIIFSDKGDTVEFFYGGKIEISGDLIMLKTNINSMFDQSVFSNPTINRGIITIHYE